MRYAVEQHMCARLITGVLCLTVCAALSHAALEYSLPPDVPDSWESAGFGILMDIDNPGGGELHWTQATPAAPWPAERWGREVVVFENKMWLVGGDAPVGSDRHDIWYSSDGANWTEALAEAPWGPRGYHECLVFGGKLWIIGGLAGYTGGDDVWSSSDGVNWTLEVEEAPWGPRDSHQCLVYEGKIWLFEGLDLQEEFQPSVWNSADGLNWTYVGDLPGQDIGFEPGTIRVFHDEMWMFGGSDWWGVLFHVRRSTDGLNWDYVGSMPPSLTRSVVFNDYIFQVGGWYDGDIDNRIWYSPDGVTWAETASSGPWSPRSTHKVVFENKLWTLGSWHYDSGHSSDVWYAKTAGAEFSAGVTAGDPPLTVQFTDESTWFSDPITDWLWNFGDGAWSTNPNPSHTYVVRGAYTVSLTVTSASGEDTETKTNYIIVQGEPGEYHSADQDEDVIIDLSELLRLVQLYNLHSFHREEGTEDGYAPGPGDTSGALHDSDYAPPDWSVGFSELLRAVQFFQARGYHACPGSEDGFCPGSG